MIPKPIGQIGTADLQALVADAVAESKTIEYKQEMPGGTREEKIKFLAAVSSFANTAGGDLLIGVLAQDGIPTAVSGIAVPSIDDEKLRLESLLADCIEPRIPRIEIAAVPCSSGQHALVVRAHRSWLAPHRVKLNDKFYGRNSTGKYPLDVSELRSAFVLSETATERIRAFRAERLIKITARENFIGLPDGPVMVIHAVPFAAFATGRQIDPYETLNYATVLPMPPGRQPGDAQTHVTLDGFSLIARPSGGTTHAYAQLFRTGALEGVTTLGGDGSKHCLIAATFENTAVAAIRDYLKVLQKLDMGLPIVVFLSFCGMSRCFFRVRAEMGGAGYYDRDPLKTDTVALPEVIFDTEPADVPAAMRMAFNTVWNGFGYQKSEMYNDRGEWQGR
jgi:hypothetical protein